LWYCFSPLGLAQLGVALAVRAPLRPGGWHNLGLVLAVAASAILQLAAVYLPPLRTLLGTSTLTLQQLLSCVVLASLPAATLLAQRRWRSRQTEAAASPAVRGPSVPATVARRP
jgi:P-type Ca2+ transporter type 2C